MEPVPESFSYQWARCSRAGRACAPIEGATAETYEVGAADLGHALVAIVQARSRRDLAGRLQRRDRPPSSQAAETVTGPLSSAPPLVAVVVQQGRQLTGAVGSWSGSGAIKYAYQWYRCDTAGAHCKSIHGATEPHLHARREGRRADARLRRARDRQDGNHERVREPRRTGRSSRPPGSSRPASRRSRACPRRVRRSRSRPAAGARLRPRSSYQWQRCNPNGRLCTPIAGATASTYAVTAADTGHALLAVVRATVGAASQDALSVATPAVVTAQTTGPSSSAPPTVAGTSQQGRQLTGSTGTWSGSGAIGYGYQWYRCDAAGAHCKSVHGATKPTYTLVAKDVGQTLGFAVHATDATGTATAYASLVGPVAAADATLVADGATDDRGRGQAGPDAPGLRAAAGTGSPPPSPTRGSAATRTAASASRSPARRPPRTPSRPATPAHALLAARPGAKAKRRLAGDPQRRHPGSSPREPALAARTASRNGAVSG